MGVKVRQKPPSKKDGRVRLYLDCYHEGNRWYEMLNLYMLPESSENKARNERTLAEATKVGADRWHQIITGQYTHPTTTEAETQTAMNRRVPFVDFFDSLKEEKSGSTLVVWESASKKIRGWERAATPLADCDAMWLASLKTYISKQSLSDNTKHNYFARVRQALKVAVQRGLISFDPSVAVKSFKVPEPKVVFLTEEELTKLASTPFPEQKRFPDITRAFLLATYLGMRMSDTRNLSWSKIRPYDETKYQVAFWNQKAKRWEHAMVQRSIIDTLCGEWKESDELVFKLPTQPTINRSLKDWAEAAKVSTSFTFHAAKRSCAMRHLKNNQSDAVILRTINNMNPRTLDHYRRVLDEQKAEAIAALPTGALDAFVGQGA